MRLIRRWMLQCAALTTWQVTRLSEEQATTHSLEAKSWMIITTNHLMELSSMAKAVQELKAHIMTMTVPLHQYGLLAIRCLTIVYKGLLTAGKSTCLIHQRLPWLGSTPLIIAMRVARRKRKIKTFDARLRCPRPRLQLQPGIGSKMWSSDHSIKR